MIFKKPKTLRISFDYDGTLTTEKGRLALSLAKGHTIFVITARDFNRNNLDLYTNLFKLGFTPSDIYFTTNKALIARKLMIDIHVDNQDHRVRGWMDIGKDSFLGEFEGRVSS